MRLYKEAYNLYKTEISDCLDNPISKENFSNWGKKFSEIKLQERRKYYSDWEYIKIEIKKYHIYLYM